MAKRGIDFISMILLGFLVIFLSTRYGEKEYFVEEIEEQAQAIQHQYAYGIIIDTLMLHKDYIRKNEFLADILQSHGVDYARIDLMARKSREIFDVRKMRAGNNYIVISTNDSIRNVLFFVYESSPADYIVYDLRERNHQ